MLIDTDLMSKKITYRPEIDGLRTLAVFAVIFNHFKLSFHGGYVGVDIFFVISGFLVSSIVLRDINNGEFSLLDFAARRVKRLYPALVTVLLVTTIVSYLWLMPPDFKKYAHTLISSLLAYSNIFFWETTDYFNSDAVFNPLLHTWSLSVEEQFYIGFPILSVIVAKFLNKRMFLTFLVLTALSLGICVWASFSKYQAANYYLLPTRAWEMLAGVLLSFYPRKIRGGALLKLIALLCMIIPMFLYDEVTKFPGLYALPPVIGAVLFIALDWKGGVIDKIFTNKFSVYLGKISYPLYLWHWPIWSLSKHRFIESSPLVIIGLLALTIALSVLTYEFVEKKMRFIKTTTGKEKMSLYATVATVTGLAVCFGIWSIKKDGLWERFPKGMNVSYYDSQEGKKKDRDLSIYNLSNTNVLRKDFGGLGAEGEKKSFILVGDSHARRLIPLIDELAKKFNRSGAAALRDAITPVPNLYYGGREDNVKYYNDLYSRIKTSEVNKVILASRWTVTIKGAINGSKERVATEDGGGEPQEAFSDFQKNFKLLVRDLVASGKTVYIVNQVPEQLHEIPRMLANSVARGTFGSVQGSDRQFYEERSGDIAAFINSLASNHVRIINSADLFFEGEVSKVHTNGVPYFSDTNHLTYEGTKLLEDSLGEIFQE